MFRLFKRKDPICGKKEEKEKGINKYVKWFCSDKCVRDFERFAAKNKNSKGSGCGC